MQDFARVGGEHGLRYAGGGLGFAQGTQVRLGKVLSSLPERTLLLVGKKVIAEHSRQEPEQDRCNKGLRHLLQL